MTTQQFIDDWFIPTGVISGVYCITFVFTFSYFLPWQQSWFPDTSAVFALMLFLPHGVRVITAWLYGWRSLIFLAPGSFASQMFLWGPASVNTSFTLVTVAGILCAALSFCLLANLGMDFRLVNSKVAHWQDVVIAGTVASVLNSVVGAWGYRLDFHTAVTRFAGDMTGMLGLMALLAAVLWLLKPRT